MAHSIARRLTALAVTAAALGASGLAAFSANSGERAPDDAAARVIAAAKEQLGDPYEWGGAGPDSWDCSGLTSTLWREVGGVDSIPRVSYAQAAWAIPVTAADALPGDLVFFDDPVSHVSLYLGDGRIIDGSSSRGGVVIRALWPAETLSYGRVPRPTMPPVRVVRGSRGALRAPPVKAAGKSRRPALVKEDGRLNAVPPLGAVSRRPLRPSAARLRAFALTSVGAPYAARGRGPSYDAGGLVSATWRRAGGGVLPTTAAALELRTTRVRVRDVLAGDFVFYGSPAVHVGIYIGAGRMVDASRALGKVVLRPVFQSDTVRFARLTPARRRTLARRAPATGRASVRKKPTVRKQPVARPKATLSRKPAAATPEKVPPPLRTTAGATKRRPLPARRPVVTPARPPRKR